MEACALKPVLCSKKPHPNEKPTDYNWRAASASATRENLWAAPKTQHGKNKQTKKNKTKEASLLGWWEGWLTNLPELGAGGPSGAHIWVPPGVLLTTLDQIRPSSILQLKPKAHPSCPVNGDTANRGQGSCQQFSSC